MNRRKRRCKFWRRRIRTRAPLCIIGPLTNCWWRSSFRRSTDERVNKVTAELFREHDTPQAMLALTQEQLEGYIFSCGLYRSKAAHILSASRDILEKFGGQVPEKFADLKSLAGVGQKTANVVSSVWFDRDAIAVDTHVFRVSNRLGLAHAHTPAKTEEQLKEVIPQRDWSKAHHWLIWHGRRVCHSQKPACGSCPLAGVCDFFAQQNKQNTAAPSPAESGAAEV